MSINKENLEEITKIPEKTEKNIKFTHLHFHTEYSLLDGANKIQNLPKKLKSLGMDSIAITDHGNMFGAIEFYSTMKKNGIKPIIGMEGYIHNGKELETDKDSKHKEERFHICLYAKNEVGYKNLMYLSSVGYTHGFHSKPRINKEILRKHSEGLICTSACLNGEVNYHLVKTEKKNRKVIRQGYEHAKKVALEYKEIFGEDFYLELMRHGINEQKNLEPDLFRLSKETDIKIVATNDTHYETKEDAINQEVYMCIGMGKKFDDPNRMKHSVTEFYIKSAEEMAMLFADIPEAIETTQEIANKCDLTIKLGDPTPPNFKFTIDYAKLDEVELPEPDNIFSLENDKKFFEFKCWQGLEERLKIIPEEEHQTYKDRLQLEVNTINHMKFPGYMLIVWDFIREAEKEKIPVGPGRGCLTKEAQVYTVENQEFKTKQINEIKKGDFVISHNNEVKKVTETFKYDIEEELYKIETFYGDQINPIILTGDHKIYLGDNQWKQAKEITSQDYLYLPIPKIPTKFNVTNEVAKYLFDQTESDNLLKFDSLEKAYQVRIELLKKKIPSELKEIKKENSSEFIISIPRKLSEHKQFEIHRNEILLKVKKIEKIKKHKTSVYDFTVDSDHSYTTTNYTVHNSAAGSLVAYALRITNLDPLKYALLFERFLNPERVSLPDIDMDFSQNERGKIIDYVQRKYGREHVAQVVTFNSLLAKGVVRDVARVMNYDYNSSNEFAKLIPTELKMTLEKAINQEPEISNKIKNDPTQKLQKIWDFSIALEGLKRNTGVHAAGVVIHNKPIWENSPVCTTAKDKNQYITQYSLNYLEDVDLIKFDFLGLKTLDVIHNALHLIKNNHNISIDWEKINIDDEATYQNLCDGKTVGIFQLESEGMQKLNRRLKPETFEDIIAVLALYRPGPMESGMLESFVKRKNGQEKVEYFYDDMTEILKPILQNTYGVIVYQEQVMQIVREIGGFSLGRSDLVRRAMGKKKSDEMKKYKSEFREGAEKKGLNGKNAEELFDTIEKFAGYGFNKSHSAAYAFITFQTAYLKVHFPAEFMASLMTSDKDNTEKIVRYVEEAKKLQIEILPPDVRLSQKEFTPVTDKNTGKSSILFGLSGIKGVGSAAIDDILKNRNKGELKTIEDFLKTVTSKVNKKVLESLIKAGGFRSFKQYNIKTLLENVELLVAYVQSNQELKNNSGGLFGDDEDLLQTDQELRLVPVEEYDEEEILEFEEESLGMFVSGHPLDKFRDEIENMKNVSKIADIELFGNATQVFFIGKMEIIERKTSKKGNPFGIVRLSDFSGKLEFMAFENQMAKLEEIEDNQEDGFPIGCKLKVEKSFGADDEVTGVQTKVFGIYPFEECEKEAKKVKTSFKDKITKLEILEEPDEVEEAIFIPDYILNLSLQTDISVLEFIKKTAKKSKGKSNLKFLIKDDKYAEQQIVVNSGFKIDINQFEANLKEAEFVS